MEAANSIPGWTLEWMNKQEGIIAVRQPSNLGKRVVLIVRNLDRGLISLEVARESQRVRGVGDILERIDDAFQRKL